MKSKNTKKLSYFIDQYNNLNGTVITREKLKQFTARLRASKLITKNDTIHRIYKNLTSILRDNPRHKSFKITLKRKVFIQNSTNKLQDIYGLGLPFLDKKTQKRLGEDAATGLNKSISNDDIYQMITDKIIKAIDDYGDLTWYSGKDDEKGKDRIIKLPLPMNYDSDKYYRGINSFMLSLYPKFKGFVKRDGKKVKQYVLTPIDDDRLFWLTFKQIKEHGGKLKKNTTSMQVVYYNFIYKNGKETIKEKEFSKLYEKCKPNKKKKSKECLELYKIPFLKYYNLFNERDITGIDFDKKRKELDEKIIKYESTIEKIEAAENIIEVMPKRPKIDERHLGSGENPNYQPLNDTVTMPYKEQYENVAMWYGTAFHELIHSTGAAKRIGRVGITDFDRFGSVQYAFEELIAELGSAFLNGQSGILLQTLKQNSIYIKGWKKKVVGMLREDNKAIFKASAQAQKAANYILDYNKNGVPKYLQKIKKTKIKKEKQPKDIINKNGQYALLGAAKNNPLQKLGFIPANSKITNPKDVFTLKGNLGKFIQKVQRVKELILLKGDKHSNKSQLAMQLANGFGELGLKVSYIDYEQGGLISKDTQNSKQWNTTKKGLENMQIVGFLDNPFADLELIAQNTDVIVVDSITDLRITANQMNDLRNKYQDVIWVFISQVKADGKMYGGNKMAHNPTKVIHCHTAREHNKRYATLEKNRGNDLDPMYAISDKKLVFTFKVFNGFNHNKGIDLFQVTGMNNEYLGEWHDTLIDAKKELNDLVNSSSEAININWNEWKK